MLCSKRIKNLLIKILDQNQINDILEILIESLFDSSTTQDKILADVIARIKNSLSNDQYSTFLLTYSTLSEQIGPQKALFILQTSIRILVKNLSAFISQVKEINLSGKSLIYEEYGDPQTVIKLKTTNIDENLSKDQIIVKWLASPLNPADINQIQGVYPVKPKLPAVPGNEGCGRVIKVSNSVKNLKEGDLILPSNAGQGTWRDYALLNSSDVFKINKNFSIENASTLQVNPPTAYRMLKDFVSLKKGDFVIQNGANSAVGKFAIQMCRIFGIKSVNIVRNRENIDELKKELKDLGADYVFTEQELTSEGRNFTKCKLALNCVGGKSSLMLGRSLDHNGVMVTYGGMSKQPVQCLTGPFIFKNISLRGFWMSRWYTIKENEEERNKMYDDIYEMYKSGELKNVKLEKRSLDNYEIAIQNQGNPDSKQIFYNEE